MLTQSTHLSDCQDLGPMIWSCCICTCIRMVRFSQFKTILILQNLKPKLSTMNHSINTTSTESSVPSAIMVANGGSRSCSPVAGDAISKYVTVPAYWFEAETSGLISDDQPSAGLIAFEHEPDDVFNDDLLSEDIVSETQDLLSKTQDPSEVKVSKYSATICKAITGLNKLYASTKRHFNGRRFHKRMCRNERK